MKKGKHKDVTDYFYSIKKNAVCASPLKQQSQQTGDHERTSHHHRLVDLEATGGTFASRAAGLGAGARHARVGLCPGADVGSLDDLVVVGIVET